MTKTAAVTVQGDKDGFFRDGSSFRMPGYFSSIRTGDQLALSPDERLLSSKKIQASKSWVFAVGGYPQNNPRVPITKPFPIGIFSLCGSQFENDYLHTRMFFLDKYQTNISVSDSFSQIYKGIPVTYQEALDELGHYDISDNFKRIRLGYFSFLTRSPSGQFSSSFFRSNSVIFNTTAHYRFVLEDVALLLESVNHMAGEEGKPAYLKATLAGMGFFAKVDGYYDIKHCLIGNYLRAYKELLETNEYPNIAHVEFPIFDDDNQSTYDIVYDNIANIKGIGVSSSARDVLAFSDSQKNDYFVCAVNPADSNSYPGNEWGDGSVESACFGNNTTIRQDQVDVMNPELVERTFAIDLQDEPTSQVRFS